MPSYQGMNAGGRWATTLEYQHDAAGMVRRILRNGQPYMGAQYRAAGRPLSRNINLPNGSLLGRASDYDARTDRPLVDLSLVAPKAGENADNPTSTEWAVGVRWIKAVDRSAAQKFPGMFANQNIVCKLRDEATLSVLLREFAGDGVS